MEINTNIPIDDCPKTHPSRRERIELFKHKLNIWTYRSNIPREDLPWAALAVGEAIEAVKGYEPKDKTPMGLIGQFCSLLEDSKLMVYAASEVDAIRELCANLGRPCEL